MSPCMLQQGVNWGGVVSNGNDGGSSHDSSIYVGL